MWSSSEKDVINDMELVQLVSRVSVSVRECNDCALHSSLDDDDGDADAVVRKVDRMRDVSAEFETNIIIILNAARRWKVISYFVLWISYIPVGQCRYAS
jgi:hypothetical protein